jgi:hypothetical protein
MYAPNVQEGLSLTIRPLSTGAIAGIVIGSVIGAAFILTLIVLFFLRKRRRRRALEADKEGKLVDEKGGEPPKLVPFVQDGQVDLADEETMGTQSRDEARSHGRSRNKPRLENGQALGVAAGSGLSSPLTDNRLSSRAEQGGLSTTVAGSSGVGQLERETKEMLGVVSPHSEQTPRPLPSTSSYPGGSSSNHHGDYTVASAKARLGGNGNDGPPTLAPEILTGRQATSPPSASDQQSPSGVGNQVEFVRHTDGGAMRVELPPLYSDVPRREG